MLQLDDGFWRLVQEGYIGCRQLSPGQYEIEGQKYVGRARIDHVDLDVSEKVPGALGALAAFASGVVLRVEQQDAVSGEFDSLSRVLMAEFTSAAGEYISQRRQAAFVYRNKIGSILAGRLDMPATIRLHASGRPGLFAFQQGVVTRDRPLDRIVLGALDELDRSASVLNLAPGTLYEARWLAGALEEVRDDAFLATTTTGFLTLIDNLGSDKNLLPKDIDLSRLATTVLLHHGFGCRTQSSTVPRALFINIEKLFEQAVYELLGEICGHLLVDKGESFERRMFTDGQDTSRTHPDVVVHTNDEVLAVGDVKYKSLTSSRMGEERPKKEGRGDLYQVLVHAASLNARRAFLIYPSDDSKDYRYLGLSATGCRMWTARVRPAHLRTDLEQLVDHVLVAGGPKQQV
ncbi:MAG TPA: hypothetical protein VFN89_02645 [Solirubrobacterales bacterium]|nr:hypothetical protein [Solirubrobacterales bacterium]